MKRTVCTFLCILWAACSLFALPSLSARAEEEEYACVLTDDVFFYERPDESSGLFLLPRTYYVRVLEKGVSYCYVQYLTDSPPFQAVYGYCKTAALAFVDYIPVRPYLYYTIEATYSLSENTSLAGDLSSLTLTYVYYGDYLVGSSVYHYVRLDDKTGYLPKTQELSYDRNTDYVAPSSSSASDASAEEDAPGEMSFGQIALTVLLICLLAGGGFFAFRPKNDPVIRR